MMGKVKKQEKKEPTDDTSTDV